MLSKIVEMTASRSEFRFAEGGREIRFRPVVFLLPDRKVAGIGEPPTDASIKLKRVSIFEDLDADALLMLESMIRYGIWKVLGGHSFRSVVLRISIEPDIRAELKGFATAVFHQAARQAGADKVVG